MTHTTIRMLIILLACCSMAWGQEATAADEVAVRDAVRTWMRLMSAGDSAALQHMVIPEGYEELSGIRLELVAAAQEMGRAAAPDEYDREATVAAEAFERALAAAGIAIDGDRATVKMSSQPDDQVPGEIALQRVGGAWKIRLAGAQEDETPEALAEQAKEARLLAQAMRNVAAKFRSGTLKQAGAIDYYVKMELVALGLKEEMSKPQEVREAEARARESAPPKPSRATPVDPLGKGEVRRMLVEGRVRRVVISPDGKTVASAAVRSGDALVLWDLGTGQRLRTFDPGSREIEFHAQGLAFSPDGKLLVCGGEGFTYLELDAWRKDQRDDPYDNIASTDHAIRIFDAATGELIRRLEGPESFVGELAFTPDGSLLISGEREGWVRAWDTETWEPAWSERHDRKGVGVGGLAVAPNGAHVVSSDPWDAVQIWEARTGKRVRQWSHEKATGPVAIAPDGRMVATGRMMTASLNQLETGEHVHDLMFMPDRLINRISALTFTPDGKRLLASDGIERDARNKDGLIEAMAGGDTSIRMWDVTSGKLLSVWEGHVNAINSLAVTPDGRHLVSGSADGSIRVWEMPK